MSWPDSYVGGPGKPGVGWQGGEGGGTQEHQRAQESSRALGKKAHFLLAREDQPISLKAAAG